MSQNFFLITLRMQSGIILSYFLRVSDDFSNHNHYFDIVNMLNQKWKCQTPELDRKYYNNEI